MNNSWCQIRSSLRWNKKLNLVCFINVPNIFQMVPIFNLLNDLVTLLSFRLKVLKRLFILSQMKENGLTEVEKNTFFKQTSLNSQCTLKKPNVSHNSSSTSSSYPLPDLVPVQERQTQLIKNNLTQIGIELREISLKFEFDSKKHFFVDYFL